MQEEEEMFECRKKKRCLNAGRRRDVWNRRKGGKFDTGRDGERQEKVNSWFKRRRKLLGGS